MKKILSLILAGLMTVSCAAFVAADDAAVEATTDPVQDYAIEFLSNCGVFKGGEGLTNEDLIQRYQMALFVSRISTGWVDDATWEDGTANDATFKDIDTEPANKYLGALSYANQNGIIEGYTANTFAPYASITYRDALTMVVRTLGYKGLSYPWGNIEKAVELGLTEGVDAAYTDELTRGEVAVIIYNAMFAKNSKGETLAKSIFGYDFGFQNIVIVSTDEYGYAANGDRAAAGYVGFKTIDENGVLGSKVYYVKASEFGFEGHEEELAVGEVFVALFEIDGDYTNLLDVASLKTATVMNDGITDNEGKAYETMPIAAALKDYTLVKDYTKGILNYTYEDLRIYAYGDVKVYDLDDGKAFIGIDASNNIVKWDGEEWVIEWFYNSELKRYYDLIVNEDNKTTDDDGEDLGLETVAGTTNVYINWMSDAEFTEWYNNAIKVLKATYSELILQDAPATKIVSGKAPYSKIDLFDIDNDAKAEIANYKSYSIGIIGKDTTTQKCTRKDNSLDHSAGVVMPAYSIASLDGAKEYVFVEAGHEKHDVDAQNAYAWLNVHPSVTTFDETKLTADGEVVLYNWNKTTGEIEIVKHITAGTNDDADSKIITGVLQAYSTSKKTVTIDGTVYPISYTNLDGDTLYLKDTEVATRRAVAAGLDSQYMQYVTAVVCDGYVVDIDLRNADSTNSIVVLAYAGITSDGYIAVYGYKTNSLKLEVIKVNSYNGWKKGDYRYYPENADEDDAFDFGSLYTIKSYDKETNSYGVYTENVETVLANATPVRVTFKNGYRSVQPMTLYRDADNDNALTWDVDGDPTITAMTSADKYVIVTGAATPAASNIYVYDGIIDDDEASYSYDIDAMMAGSLDSKTVILYDLSCLPGTDWSDWVMGEDVDPIPGSDVDDAAPAPEFYNNSYDVAYVVYEKVNGEVLDAAYDEAIGGTYLLGSTLSEVSVFNLLTGKRDAVIASSNIDLVRGHLYMTIGGQIIKDLTDVCTDEFSGIHDFIDLIGDAYAAQDLNNADYLVAENVTLTAETYSDLVLAIELGLYDDVNGSDAEAWLENADGTDLKIADAMIDAKTIYTWTDDEEWNWYGHDRALELTKIDELEDGFTYTAALVYDVAGKDVVIYILDDEATIVADEDPEILTNDGATGNDPVLFTGGDLTKHSAPYRYVVNSTNGDTRYFDIAAEYTVEALFNDDDCQGDLTDLNLTELNLYLVELSLPETAGDPLTYAKLADCEDHGMHDMLAKEGVGFGGDGFDEDVIVEIEFNGNTYTFDADEVTVESKACGLGVGITIDLRDVNDGADQTDAGLALARAAMNELTIKVYDGNTQTGEFELGLKAHHIGDNTAEPFDTFDGMDEDVVYFDGEFEDVVHNIEEATATGSNTVLLG